MNVKEMKDEELLRWFEHGIADVRGECRAELLSRLSRGALAERKLAVAMDALKEARGVLQKAPTTNDYDFEHWRVDFVYRDIPDALAEIEAMKE